MWVVFLFASPFRSTCSTKDNNTIVWKSAHFFCLQRLRHSQRCMGDVFSPEDVLCTGTIEKPSQYFHVTQNKHGNRCAYWKYVLHSKNKCMETHNTSILWHVIVSWWSIVAQKYYSKCLPIFMTFKALYKVCCMY